MKFALAALLSLSAVTAFDKQSLLRKAVKVGSGRRLEQGAQVTSAHSIKFNQCLSLSVEPQDMDTLTSEDNIGYAMDGLIASQKSYVLFNVCETEYCSYAADDDNLYMVDLATYMQAVMEYLPTRKANYCDACQESYDTCL